MNKFYTFAAVVVFVAVFVCRAEMNNVVISWGDYAVLYGAATDSALDTPEGIEAAMKRWKGRGYTGVYWRSDLAQLDPNEVIRNTTTINPQTYGLMRVLDEINEKFDVVAFAKAAAERHGLDFYIYHPNVYSDGAPAGAPGLTFEWGYVMRYAAEHPEVITIDKHGNPYYSVMEYAYPGARQSKVDEFVYMAQKYGIKNFYVGLRPEADQMQPQPEKADQFGFNPPVADAMQGLYGINILTDPRFDIHSGSWSPYNTDVQKWHALRGEYLTQFYRELRAALDAVDPDIHIATRTPGTDNIGPVLGNWHVDWRTWIEEGLIDELILYGQLTYVPDWSARGYIQNTHPISTFRSFVNNSANPDCKIIQAGQACYTPYNLTPGSDGWRTDWSTEAYDVAWAQRWRQWKKDIGEFGGIYYIRQDFDDFPIQEYGYRLGWGSFLYDHDLRACPGFWYSDSTNSFSMPMVQEDVAYSGRAMMLFFTSGVQPLKVRHWSDWLFVDPSISGGTCRLSFRVYRPYNESKLSAYVQYDGTPNDASPAVNIDSGTGEIRYYSQGSWKPTGQTCPAESWKLLTLEIDLEGKTYSGYLGPSKSILLWQDVPYTLEANKFNQLSFSPDGGVSYIDDIELFWEPQLESSPKSNNIYLAEDFELYGVDTSVVGRTPAQGHPWQGTGSSSNFYVENDLSFGDGYKTLAARREGGSYLYSNSGSPIPLNPSEIVTVDCDVFLPTSSQLALELWKNSADVTAGVFFSSDIFYWNGLTHAYVNSSVDTTKSKWFHVQIVLDNSTRKYRVTIQLPGKLPQLIATGHFDTAATVPGSAYFMINPQGSVGTVSYVDNVEITYGELGVCGDEFHPYPVGDITEDCVVDFSDVAIFSQHWMESSLD